MGGRREGGLDRRVERGRRRPRLDRQGPRPRIQAWQDAVFAARREQPTDVIEGDDGDLPDRPGHRDRPGRGRPGLDQQAQGRQDQRRPLPRPRSGRRRPARTSTTRSSPTRASAGPQRHVLEIFIQAPATPPGADGDQGPPHPLLPEGRSAERVQPFPPTTRPGRGPARGRRRPTTSSQGRPVEVRRASPAPRATRRRPRATTGPAASCRTSIDDAAELDPGVRRRDLQADGLKPGDLLPPVQSEFGWHVIQFMDRPPDSDEMNEAQDAGRDGGADFGQLAATLRGRRGRQGRRHRLGRPRPARRPADDGDLRRAGRRSSRRRRHPGRRRSTSSRSSTSRRRRPTPTRSTRSRRARSPTGTPSRRTR